MLYYCYQCQRTVHAETDQTLRCSICHGEFIEEANVPDDQISDDHDEAGEAMDLNDIFRIISNNLSGQQQQPSQNNPSNSSRSQSSSRGGFLGSLLSGLMQQGNPSSSSSAGPRPNPNSQSQPNSAQPGGDAMMEFMNQLFANMASNAGPGVRVHFHFGEAPVHGNINNYVFGETAFDQLISQLLNQSELVQQGLEESELAQLPKTQITSTQVDNGLQCTTCMETFALDEEVVQLPCKHVFHDPCIVPWLKKQRTCPICRKEIPKKEKTESVITDIDELD